MNKQAGILVTCDLCNTNLATVYAEDGYSAEWWANKTLNEHEAEYHD